MCVSYAQTSSTYLPLRYPPDDSPLLLLPSFACSFTRLSCGPDLHLCPATHSQRTRRLPVNQEGGQITLQHIARDKSGCFVLRVFFYFIFLFFPWEHFHSRFCNFSGRFSSHKSLPKPRGKKQLWRQGENDDIRPDIRTLELLIKKTNCAFLSCSSGLGTLLWTVSSRLLRWDEDEDEDRTVEEEEEV